MLQSLLAAFTTPATYPSWSAARAAAGAYDNDLVHRFRLARSAGFQSDGSILKRSALRDIGLARVVDFGGATGELGAEFIAAFPGSAYIVVENPRLVAMIGDSYRGVTFTATQPHDCDVFYTSGTLQYIADPLAILTDGFASARKLVILERNAFSETETFHVQKAPLFDNGMGPIPRGYSNKILRYAHRTIRESDVGLLAKENGFRKMQATTDGSIVFVRVSARALP